MFYVSHCYFLSLSKQLNQYFNWCINLSEIFQQQVEDLTNPLSDFYSITSCHTLWEGRCPYYRRMLFLLSMLLCILRVQQTFENENSFWQLFGPYLVKSQHYDSSIVECNLSPLWWMLYFLEVGLCLCSVLGFWFIFFGTYIYLRDVKFTFFSNAMSIFFLYLIQVLTILPSLYNFSYSY